MKKIFLSISIFILFIILSPVAFAATPVINFSDLTSGPKIGGENNKGVFVTIWGENFGNTRGTSTVTVGGGLVDNYPVWSNTKVTFQLGANATTGDIVLTTTDGSSAGIPFTIRVGNIYFVTPNGNGDGSFASPFSPSDYSALLAGGEDGATAYFRAGIYDEDYAYPNWHANFCLTSTYSGAVGNENAFVGYPNEIAEIRTSDSTSADRNNFRITSNPAKYIVISNLKLYAKNGSIGSHTGWRVIGNDVNGIHVNSGSGIIGTGVYQDATPNYIYIYGNEIHGGSSGNKLDHAIYPGSGVNQLYIGWNYIHDNNFAEGPMISLNCNEAYTEGLVSRDIYIHDNRIDVNTFPSRAIGVYETGANSEVFVYNNIIDGPAPNGNSSVYAMSGAVHYFNNSFFHAGGENLASVLLFYSSTTHGHLYKPDSVEVKNNIIYASNISSYYIKRTGDAPVPIVSNNLFYNIASPRGDDQFTLDTNSVVGDPLYINGATHDFKLQSTSPAIDAGTSVITVLKDFLGISRPQGSAYDIGAFEYSNSPSNYRADVNNSGTINIFDANLTFQKALGLDMSGTGWINNTNTGDANCNNSTNIFDANLIFKHSLGLDVGGEGWCVN